MGGGGPIVRKYGFPNFDKIFGAKPLGHGVEDEVKETSAQKEEEKKTAKKKKKK